MKRKTKKKAFAELSPSFAVTVKGTDPDQISRALDRIQRVEYGVEMVQGAVDKASLMALHDEDVRDSLLFEYLEQDPAFLASVFAREKVARWQSELFSKDAIKAREAEGYLKRIGNTLALKGTGQRDRLHGRMLVMAQLKDFYTTILWSYDYDEAEEFLRSLEEYSGIALADDKEIRSLMDDPDSGIGISTRLVPKMANLIIARLFSLSEGTVEMYLKKVIEVSLDGDLKGFAIEY